MSLNYASLPHVLSQPISLFNSPASRPASRRWPHYISPPRWRQPAGSTRARMHVLLQISWKSRPRTACLEPGRRDSCSAPVASVALYCKQCYVTGTLHYMRHNNDVITDVKFSGLRFLLFSWHAQKLLVFQGNSRTRTEPVLLWTPASGIYCLQYIPITWVRVPVPDGYPDSCLYQCERGLTVVW